MNGVKSSWWPVASGVLHGSVLGPVMPNIFMIWMRGLNIPSDSTKLGRIVDLLEGQKFYRGI